MTMVVTTAGTQEEAGKIITNKKFRTIFIKILLISLDMKSGLELVEGCSYMLLLLSCQSMKNRVCGSVVHILISNKPQLFPASWKSM
jgi:hypothetical protein